MSKKVGDEMKNGDVVNVYGYQWEVILLLFLTESK